MYVISVIPLKRGIQVETLTYFGSQEYHEGTIVTIPVRNSTILGLVTESKELSTAKTALRAATFSLRKLPPQESLTVLGSAYISTAQELSSYYAANMGQVLYNLLPAPVRNGDIPLPHTHHPKDQSPIPPQLLQATKKERYLVYRSLVRETFAHSGSVLIVVPTSIDAAEMERTLDQGIADRVILLTSSLTATECKKAYAALEDFSKTKLIIATPTHSLIERHDIMLVIVENARSSYYKEMVRPFIDYRDALRIHAHHSGRRILFADLLPRTEEEDLRRKEIFHTYGETPKRIELSGEIEVVKMSRDKDANEPFKLFSDEVIEAIKETRKKKGRIFLFAARRGLAPIVGCMDCGYVFRSEESGAPYSLLRTMKNGQEERWFVCNTSGERIPAAHTCIVCGSWRLRERGIGIQQVYDELHKLFPTVPTILFDHITARTYKKAAFLRETFYKSRGNMLLGTHMAVPYLTEDIDLTIVVNMDALLATPTWRLEEENLALLLRLREITKGKILVQTRASEVGILATAKQANVQKFYTEELALRKSFNYPPYATFIHLTWQGKAQVVKEIEGHVAAVFKEFGVSIYHNPSSTEEAPIMYALMRVPASSWPNQNLVALLKTLPPSVRVIINPDKIV